jgi:hypothetical protein
MSGSVSVVIRRCMYRYVHTPFSHILHSLLFSKGAGGASAKELTQFLAPLCVSRLKHCGLSLTSGEREDQRSDSTANIG